MISYSVVIPAAGRGSRMGSSVPKVLLSISTSGESRPQEDSILKRTVRVFAEDPNCLQIVVCVPAEWRGDCEGEVRFTTKAFVVEGGATRQQSVMRGIEALVDRCGAEQDSVVLVHDAARCCVSAEVVGRVVAGVKDYGAVTAAVPIVDSLSRADNGVLTHYVDRDSLWSIQTPQGFFVRDLLAAHREAQQQGVQALDDAALVARHRSVCVVLGDRLNVKVTEPNDLLLAAQISSQRTAHMPEDVPTCAATKE